MILNRLPFSMQMSHPSPFLSSSLSACSPYLKSVMNIFLSFVIRIKPDEPLKPDRYLTLRMLVTRNPWTLFLASNSRIPARRDEIVPEIDLPSG